MEAGLLIPKQSGPKESSESWRREPWSIWFAGIGALEEQGSPCGWIDPSLMINIQSSTPYWLLSKKSWDCRSKRISEKGGEGGEEGGGRKEEGGGRRRYWSTSVSFCYWNTREEAVISREHRAKIKLTMTRSPRLNSSEKPQIGFLFGCIRSSIISQAINLATTRRLSDKTRANGQ